MKRHQMGSVLAMCALAIAASACGAEPDPVNVELCEHLEGADASTVTAAQEDPPSVAADHRRYDIQLPEAGEARGGSVRFVVGEGGDYLVGLNKDVPLRVQDSEGAEITAEETVTSVPECEAVKARHTFGLGVGTYTFTLGPTPEATVGLALERGEHGEEHGH